MRLPSKIGAGLEIAALERVVGFHHEGVFHALLRADHFVVNQCGAIRRRAGNPHADEETWGDEARVPVF